MKINCGVLWEFFWGCLKHFNSINKFRSMIFAIFAWENSQKKSKMSIHLNSNTNKPQRPEKALPIFFL